MFDPTRWPPGAQLATLRNLFEMLATGTMRLGENGVDVTEREIEKLKPDIAYLERLLERSLAES
jgi:hypothetical protein